MKFVLKLMNWAFQMMDFVLKMMTCALKMMKLVFKWWKLYFKTKKRHVQCDNRHYFNRKLLSFQSQASVSHTSFSQAIVSHRVAPSISAHRVPHIRLQNHQAISAFSVQNPLFSVQNSLFSVQTPSISVQNSLFSVQTMMHKQPLRQHPLGIKLSAFINIYKYI